MVRSAASDPASDTATLGDDEFAVRRREGAPLDLASALTAAEAMNPPR